MKRVTGMGLLLLLGCSSHDAVSVHAGTLAVSLTTAGANDGAVVLVVSGAPVSSVAAAGGYDVTANTDGQGTHILVMGNVTAGAVAMINVPDLSLASTYVVTVEQVADRDNYGLLDPARYRASVGPAQ